MMRMRRRWNDMLEHIGEEITECDYVDRSIQLEQVRIKLAQPELLRPGDSRHIVPMIF